MSRNTWLGTAVALLVLVLIFTIQNAVTVSVRFLFWSFTMPRVVLIFLVFVIGVVVGWSLRAVIRRARRRNQR
jgi:uncharacterized integral membrane protein